MSRSKFSDLEIESAIQDYATGMTMKEVGEKYGACRGWLYYILKARKIKARPKYKPISYKIDTSYFEKIDSHEKAICLGFIWADGSIARKWPHLRITVHKRDVEYLEWMNREMKNERPIYHHAKFVTLVGYHPKIVKDLSGLGIYPGKSLTIGFPTPDQVPDEFLSSFVLGVFEGDGSISKSDSKTFCANICGTDAFCQWIKALLRDKLGMSGSITYAPTKAGPLLARIGISGNFQVIKFMEWMYSKASHKMGRKYEKYLELRGLYDENLKMINDGRASESKKECNRRARSTWTLSSEAKKSISIKHSKIFYAKDPSGLIINGRGVKKFAQENKLGVCSFGNLIKRTRTSYLGWTIPTPEEIAAAQSTGSIIEKFY